MDPRLIDKMLWNWAVIQDKATQNLCKSLPKEKAVSQPLPLPLHLFLAKRNDLFLLLYRGVIVVMRGCFCWRWDSWWLIEEKKRWARRRRVSTIPRVLGEMASHRQMLWSARLLPAVVGKFVFSSTGFIWFQIWWKQWKEREEVFCHCKSLGCPGRGSRHLILWVCWGMQWLSAVPAA